MDNLIKLLDDIFVGKAPALSENAKEWIVKYGPWITIVLIILFLPFLLFLFGVSGAIAPLGGAVDPAGTGGLAFAWVFLVVSLGLEIAALPGLFKRRMQGWILLFYGVLFSALYNLFTFNWIGLILGSIISLYILMQIRLKYA